jgi:hypothetical protein
MENDTQEEVKDLEATTEESETKEAEEEQEEEKPVESPEAKRARLKRQLEQHNKKYGFKEEDKPKPTPEVKSKKDDLTMQEAMTLMKSNVHEEDIESVKRFAKLENISIADALKHDELKAVLRVREEKRKTSEATSTGKTPRGTSQVSDEVILERANKGQVPDAGSKEAEALFWARHGGRRS